MKVSALMLTGQSKDYLHDYSGRLGDDYKVSSIVGGSLINSKSQKRATSGSRINKGPMTSTDTKLQNYRGSSQANMLSRLNQNTSTFAAGD